MENSTNSMDLLFQQSATSSTNAKKAILKSLNLANTVWESFLFPTIVPATNLLIAKISKPITRWIVEAWERLLTNHFRNLENPHNASIVGSFRFDKLPAVVRVRVTTPNVLNALRKTRSWSCEPLQFLRTPRSC
jgi:hypothetical protein